VITASDGVDSSSQTLNFNISDVVALCDVDMNGACQAFDASLVLQHVVGLVTLDANQLLAADMDGNGLVQAVDASLILQAVVAAGKK